MAHKKPNRTKLERETIFLFNDEEETAVVSTTSPSMAKKLKRRLGVGTEIYPGTFDWVIPKDFIKLPINRKKRTISKEHKDALTGGIRKPTDNPDQIP